MENTIDKTEYGSWFSYLFPSPSYGNVWVGSVSAGVSLGLFSLGFIISKFGGVKYLKIPEVYLGTFSVFWGLVVLGWADRTYVNVWNKVRHAFNVDDETYRAVVTPQLERIYDERRILVYAAVLAVPHFVIAAVSYFPGAPFHTAVVNAILGGTTKYDNGVATVVILWLFGAANALLIATIVNGFLGHLTLVREVADLPFQHLPSSASDLKPVGIFTIMSATVWFAGISLVMLWTRNDITRPVEIPIIILLILMGGVFFLAPQMILHSALLDAKRDKIVEIREEYKEIHKLTQMDKESSENLSLRLEVVDRRLENAKSISTWVYDFASVSKLVAASVIPWLSVVEQIVTDVLPALTS